MWWIDSGDEIKSQNKQACKNRRTSLINISYISFIVYHVKLFIYVTDLFIFCVAEIVNEREQNVTFKLFLIIPIKLINSILSSLPLNATV